MFCAPNAGGLGSTSGQGTWFHMLHLDLVQPNKYFKKSQKESTYLASTIMSIQFRTMRTLLKSKFLEASQGPTLQAALSNDSSQICCVTSFSVRLDTLQIWQNWPFYANIRMTKESNNRPHKYYKTNNFVSFYYLSTEKKNGQVSWQWQRTKANPGKILNGDIAFKEIKKKKRKSN